MEVVILEVVSNDIIYLVVSSDAVGSVYSDTYVTR